MERFSCASSEREVNKTLCTGNINFSQSFIVNDSEIMRNEVFNPNQFELQLIRIKNLFSDWFGFIRIVTSDYIGLGRIGFLAFFIKRVTKPFSDWFGIIRIGSDTDIGMNQNSSDWLGMNSYPILSPG